MQELTYKIADQGWEFDQIHRLNYETFVEEIPQHERNPDQILVDKYHSENTYIVCVDDQQVLAMVAIRDQRPFSLDHKLDSLDDYLPPGYGGICEVRLLSIRRNKRYRKVLSGLIKAITDYCKSRNYRLAVISATTRQLPFYKKVGFVPFGPLVGKNGARYQPMYVTADSYNEFMDTSPIFRRNKKDEAGTGDDKNKNHILLPGPVGIRKEISEEFGKPPVSHRSKLFVEDFKYTSGLLSSLAGSKYAEIIMGSGTLANDIIAAQLSLTGGKGLILSNGEFGERLKDHARRYGLNYREINEEWGDAFDIIDIERKLRDADTEWVWMVHCETSTGVLNDIRNISDICKKKGIRICADCISSIGNVPLDLGDVYLASGVSGKGLGSYPGLCFVFYNHEPGTREDELPRYLDLAYYHNSYGVPFTFSSNHLYALKRSLELIDVESKLNSVKAVSSRIRKLLSSAGLDLLGRDETCLPAVVTFKIPDELSSEKLGAELEQEGYFLSYRSGYLLERNLMQIAIMGEYIPAAVEELVSLIIRKLN